MAFGKLRSAFRGSRRSGGASKSRGTLGGAVGAIKSNRFSGAGGESKGKRVPTRSLKPVRRGAVGGGAGSLAKGAQSRSRFAKGSKPKPRSTGGGLTGFLARRKAKRGAVKSPKRQISSRRSRPGGLSRSLRNRLGRR